MKVARAGKGNAGNVGAQSCCALFRVFVEFADTS
jgi:hypothetical protein